jgi:methyltransferase (TIGR00027 family)
MNADRPSTTALRVAIARAAHQTVDAAPRVLEDPLALRIIGPEWAARLSTAAGRRRSRNPFSLGLRAFVVARSRLAEDELAQALARGVRQYVVLGAGLDTFSCRNARPPAELRVFEVDHPATQAWKLRLLAQAGIEAPPSACFVAVDFERQSWMDALQQAGFRADLPAHFAWLGVSMYLAAAEVEATLAAIASLPGGSSVSFDYLEPYSQLGPLRRAVLGLLSGLVALLGEPLKSHFSQEAMRRLLAARGFIEVDDQGPEALNARLFPGRSDRLAVGVLGRIVSARL